MTQAFNLALHANFIDASGKVSASGLQAGAIPESFPSGTIMLFVQTSAPTGWIKSTGHNNKSLRVVSGTAGAGGSVAFTTAFANQTVSGTNGATGATTLTTAQIPSHTHTYNANDDVGSTQLRGAVYADESGLYIDNVAFNTGATGGGGSHTHTSGAFTGTAINLAVQYVDVIICTKS
jgi:microcystin-dependent protein